MAKERDRFDALKREPGRVGSHRGPVRRGGGWLGLALFLVGLIVITAGGLFVVDRVMRDTSPTGQGLDFNFPFLPELVPTPTPSETPPPPVVSDPAIAVERGLTIMVINGTPVTGLQNTVGDELLNAGWPIGTRARAGDSDVLDTIVYYADPANADIARGLVEILGFGEAKEVDPNVYPGQSIVIVIGMDHPAVPKPTEEPAEVPAEEQAG
ncbi:MAG TPA: LytR C-terminal domain-containing protein [Microbacteriaceae bacterium]|nr:LytR C-terminal domain-containing protein [Microbacteriaceae bacterium]